MIQHFHNARLINPEAVPETLAVDFSTHAPGSWLLQCQSTQRVSAGCTAAHGRCSSGAWMATAGQTST